MIDRMFDVVLVLALCAWCVALIGAAVWFVAILVTTIREGL